MLRNSSELLNILSGEDTDTAPSEWFQKSNALSSNVSEQEDNISIESNSNDVSMDDTNLRSQANLRYISNDESSNTAKGTSTKPNRSQSLDTFSQRRRKSVARDEDWLSGSSLSSLNSFSSDGLSDLPESDLSDLSDWSSASSSIKSYSDESEIENYPKKSKILPESDVDKTRIKSRNREKNRDRERERARIKGREKEKFRDRDRDRNIDRGREREKGKAREKGKIKSLSSSGRPKRDSGSKSKRSRDSNDNDNDNNDDSHGYDNGEDNPNLPSSSEHSKNPKWNSFYEDATNADNLDEDRDKPHDEYRIRFRRKPGRRRKVDLLEPNRKDDQGKPQLLYFASRGDVDSCKKLVKHGAFIGCKDMRGWTVLHEAARQGDIDLASFAVKVSDATNKKTEYIDINSQNTSGNTPLHEAVAYQNYEMVMFLLQNGARADIANSLQQTPIDINKSKSIRKLLENSKNLLRTAIMTNKAGQTRLHRECREGNFDNAVKQLNLGVDINTADNAGWTPLHEASLAGHADLVKELLRRSASVHKRGLEGDTPLHDASANGHTQVVQYLLEAGADYEAKNQNGITPIDMAMDDSVLKVLNSWKNSRNKGKDLEDQGATEDHKLSQDKPVHGSPDKSTPAGSRIKVVPSSRGRHRVVYDSSNSDGEADQNEESDAVKPNKRMQKLELSDSDGNSDTKSSKPLDRSSNRSSRKEIKKTRKYSEKAHKKRQRENDDTEESSVNYYFSSSKPAITREERKLKSILSTLERLERKQKHHKKPSLTKSKFEKDSKSSPSKQGLENKVKGLGISNIRAKSSTDLKSEPNDLEDNTAVAHLASKNSEVITTPEVPTTATPKRRRGRPPKSRENSALIPSKSVFTPNEASVSSSKDNSLRYTPQPDPQSKPAKHEVAHDKPFSPETVNGSKDKAALQNRNTNSKKTNIPDDVVVAPSDRDRRSSEPANVAKTETSNNQSPSASEEEKLAGFGAKLPLSAVEKDSTEIPSSQPSANDESNKKPKAANPAKEEKETTIEASTTPMDNKSSPNASTEQSRSNDSVISSNKLKLAKKPKSKPPPSNREILKPSVRALADTLQSFTPLFLFKAYHTGAFKYVAVDLQLLLFFKVYQEAKRREVSTGKLQTIQQDLSQFQKTCKGATLSALSRKQKKKFQSMILPKIKSYFLKNKPALNKVYHKILNDTERFCELNLHFIHYSAIKSTLRKTYPDAFSHIVTVTIESNNKPSTSTNKYSLDSICTEVNDKDEKAQGPPTSALENKSRQPFSFNEEIFSPKRKHVGNLFTDSHSVYQPSVPKSGSEIPTIGNTGFSSYAIYPIASSQGNFGLVSKNLDASYPSSYNTTRLSCLPKKYAAKLLYSHNSLYNTN